MSFSRGLIENAFLAEDQPEGCQNPHSMLGSSMDRCGVDVDSPVIAKNWSSIVFYGVSLGTLRSTVLNY